MPVLDGDVMHHSLLVLLQVQGNMPPTLKTHPEMSSKASKVIPAASDSNFYLYASQSVTLT